MIYRNSILSFLVSHWIDHNFQIISPLCCWSFFDFKSVGTPYRKTRRLACIVTQLWFLWSTPQAFSLRLGDGGHPSSMPSVSVIPVPCGHLYNHTHTAETEKGVAWICRDFCLHISGVRSQPHLGQKVVFTLGDHTPRICLWEKVKND